MCSVIQNLSIESLHGSEVAKDFAPDGLAELQVCHGVASRTEMHVGFQPPPTVLHDEIPAYGVGVPSWLRWPRTRVHQHHLWPVVMVHAVEKCIQRLLAHLQVSNNDVRTAADLIAAPQIEIWLAYMAVIAFLS